MSGFLPHGLTKKQIDEIQEVFEIFAEDGYLDNTVRIVRQAMRSFGIKLDKDEVLPSYYILIDTKTHIAFHLITKFQL